MCHFMDYCVINFLGLDWVICTWGKLRGMREDGRIIPRIEKWTFLVSSIDFYINGVGDPPQLLSSKCRQCSQIANLPYCL